MPDISPLQYTAIGVVAWALIARHALRHPAFLEELGPDPDPTERAILSLLVILVAALLVVIWPFALAGCAVYAFAAKPALHDHDHDQETP